VQVRQDKPIEGKSQKQNPRISTRISDQKHTTTS